MQKKFPFLRLALSLAFLLFGVLRSQAQTSAQWTLDTTIDNVSCYHMITKCGNDDAVLLKFVNHEGEVKVSWESIYDTDISQNTPHPKGRQELTLVLNGISAQDCSGSEKKLYITAPDLCAACSQIHNFKFSGISIQ